MGGAWDNTLVRIGVEAAGVKTTRRGVPTSVTAGTARLHYGLDPPVPAPTRLPVLNPVAQGHKYEDTPRL